MKKQIYFVKLCLCFFAFVLSTSPIFTQIGPITIDSYVIDDDDDNFGPDQSKGDNDDKLDQGEIIRLPVVLWNNGASDAEEVNASIQTSNANVILIDSVEVYETISAGQKKSPVASANRGGFIFQIAQGAAMGEVLFELEISSGDSTFLDSLSLEIIGTGTIGPLTISNFSIDDDDDKFGPDQSQGDDDGLIEQGETIILPVQLQNNGGAPAFDVTATVRTTNTDIILIDSVEVYHTIGDGISKDPVTSANRGGFMFQVSPNASSGEAMFILEVLSTYTDGFIDSFEVSIHGDGVIGPLIISDFSIDDDSNTFGPDQSQGDNDGIIEQGEVIRLPLEIQNMGTAPAFDVTTTIRTINTDIILIDSVEIYHTIGDGMSKNSVATANRGGFLFQVSPNASSGEVMFILEVLSTYTDGFIDSFEVSLNGNAIVGPLIISDFSIDDDSNTFGPDQSQGDNDGIIEQEEIIRLPVEIRNNGSAPAFGVVANIKASNTGIILIDSIESYETIGDRMTKLPVASANRGGFLFQVSPDAINSEVIFDLEITNSIGAQFNDQILLNIGGEADATPPIVSINSPNSQTRFPIKGFNISVSYTDNPQGSGIDINTLHISNDQAIGEAASPGYRLAGENLASLFQITPDSAHFIIPDSMTFPFGENKLTAVIQDRAGRTSTKSVSFETDVFGLIKPKGDVIVNTSPLAIEGFSIEPAVYRVEINGSIIPISNDRFVTDIQLSEGDNLIIASAFDSNELLIRSDTISVTLDQVLPTLAITTPITMQEYNYSPILVEGTVSDEQSVMVFVNGQEAEVNENVFRLGDGISSGLEIEEGGNEIIVTAIDEGGNISEDTILIEGVPPPSPPGKLKLFLKKEGRLSLFPFITLPSISFFFTHFFFDTGSKQTWSYPLKGDIEGNEYTMSVRLGSLSLEFSEFQAELILKSEGKESILADTNLFGTTCCDPQGFFGTPHRVTAGIEGLDPESSLGDSLLFRLTKVSPRIPVSAFASGSPEVSYILIPAELATSIHEDSQVLRAFNLSQNYPNPFQEETTISYQLSKEAYTRLEIYNMLNQSIITLVNQKQTAGHHSIKWNAVDDQGNKVPSDFYIYKLQADNLIRTRKMLYNR